MKKRRTAFDAAEEKGRQAALAGEARAACPYIDWRTGYHHGVTFSRAFRRYWLRGYDEASAGDAARNEPPAETPEPC